MADFLKKGTVSDMQIITGIREMKGFSDSARKEGKTIAFVPTMGYLHDGHMSLLKEGRKYDCLVMSIFVNPIQFGSDEDYNTYPRDMEMDLKIAADSGVDIVFNPKAGEIFPEGFKTHVAVSELSSRLCGISRPLHFQGVATVVAKLFNIVKPDVAIFGQKDFQQFIIIKQMVKDLNIDIEIVGIPVVREKDGLAMSSRNKYLTPEERIAGTCIYRGIMKGMDVFDIGERDTDIILREVRNVIENEPSAKVDYVKICDITTLEGIKVIKNSALLAAAVWIGRTRLIDNCVLGRGLM